MPPLAFGFTRNSKHSQFFADNRARYKKTMPAPQMTFPMALSQNTVGKIDK
jgi:hypothetical protein